MPEMVAVTVRLNLEYDPAKVLMSSFVVNPDDGTLDSVLTEEERLRAYLEVVVAMALNDTAGEYGVRAVSGQLELEE